jgi:hypothetical protein
MVRVHHVTKSVWARREWFHFDMVDIFLADRDVAQPSRGTSSITNAFAFC